VILQSHSIKLINYSRSINQTAQSTSS